MSRWPGQCIFTQIISAGQTTLTSVLVIIEFTAMSTPPCVPLALSLRYMMKSSHSSSASLMLLFNHVSVAIIISGLVVSRRLRHAPFLPVRDWQFTLMILSGLPLAVDGLYFVGDDVPNGLLFSSRLSILILDRLVESLLMVWWWEALLDSMCSMAGEVSDSCLVLHIEQTHVTLSWPSMEYSAELIPWHCKWYQVSQVSHITDFSSQVTGCWQVLHRYTVLEVFVRRFSIVCQYVRWGANTPVNE